jgi:D-glycerate 3-kinase
MVVAASPDPRILEAALGLIERGLSARARRPLVLGICGAQGSGKSTLAAAIVARFPGRAASLSLDDLYLTRTERQRLALAVHPLLATRGVPGTHDVALGLATFAALDHGEPAALPRFDKACDDRAPREDWSEAPANCELVIFEGWCVGARPQPEGALGVPVNALERVEDPDAVWRRHANAALAGNYADLFARIDTLLLLAAPGFEVVYGWRHQQEQALRYKTGGGLDDAALARFVQHYERLTNWMLEEMPARADVTVRLDVERRVLPSF